MALKHAQQVTDYQLAGAKSFEKFLNSDTFLEYRFGSKACGGWRADNIAQIVEMQKTGEWESDGYPDTPCLLDLIDVWVVLGDATKVCTSFESFLVTIIQIADWWDNGLATDRRAVLFTLLWPDTLGLDGEQDPGPEIAFGPYRASQGDDDFNALAINHPVLNRTRWEAIQQAR